MSIAKFNIIGVGPGTGKYIIPAARDIIMESDVLIGGRRNLDEWSSLNKEEVVIKADLKKIADYIAENRNSKIISVLVSGDPGFYSILDYLSGKFSGDDYTVVPGLSSVQVAFARLGMPWHDADLVNIHGRGFDALEKYIGSSKVAMLTDSKNNPRRIAEFFSGYSKDMKIAVCSNIGYENEKIYIGNVCDWDQLDEFSYTTNVTVVFRKNGDEKNKRQ